MSTRHAAWLDHGEASFPRVHAETFGRVEPSAPPSDDPRQARVRERFVAADRVRA